MSARSKENRVLILVGPTAVGKTGVSILLAERLGTEIISADSMQIYRGMDIGTAKPSPEDMARVKHHMIDIVEPSGGFSAGEYLERVKRIIDALHDRDKVPLIVGGTGLYVKALTRGIFEAPSADRKLRRRLLDEERKKKGVLYRRLLDLDPERASQLEAGDLRRIVRALEVIILTGKRMSEMIVEDTRPFEAEFIKIGLTRKRSELYEIINSRVEEMFKKGLVEEVRRLLEKSPSETPLQAIGYKETIAYLNGEMEYSELVEEVKKATRRYAKRQFTWFRKEEGIRWVDITGINSPERILEKLLEVEEVRALLK
ncbi:MAG: tRNA (adenosine(37)-N6)-dimethylallyltransferase MiaA [Nitrospirae bacterium]|nr:MAG: tRNA (adenosine(37)-N6)-dimethylallyltransferase MiaA [Nitrospirota bacterium]